MAFEYPYHALLRVTTIDVIGFTKISNPSSITLCRNYLFPSSLHSTLYRSFPFMTAIITLIVIALFSWLAIKVATTALMMTGLSFDTASFQSYSAFFGVGFTTREAELVVNHPVRRRIIRDLILVGNIGLTSALATMVATFVQGTNVLHSLLIIVAAASIALAISYIGRLRLLRRTLDRWISYSLTHAGLVRALDYELLLRVEHGYVVSEYLIEPQNPLVGKMLRESRPWDSGVIVLAIRRNDDLLPGIPGPSQTILAGDILILYGQEKDALQLMQLHSGKTS